MSTILNLPDRCQEDEVARYNRYDEGRKMSRPNKKLEMAFVRVLVVLFGTGSWVTVSGVVSELPVLIARGIPEQYRINSYIGVIVNMALIGPLVFIILNHFASTRFGLRRAEIPMNYVLTSMGTIGTFLLIFCWDYYTVWSVDGNLHSSALLILVFFTATVDLSSNLTFVGYMSILKPNFLNWYWLGQGLSGMLPAVVSLIQTGGGRYVCSSNVDNLNETGTGNDTLSQNCKLLSADKGVRHDALFEPGVFFGCLSFMMFMCQMSFIGLNTLPCAKREYASPRERQGNCCGTSAHILCCKEGSQEGFELLDESSATDTDTTTHDTGEQSYLADTAEEPKNLSRNQFIFLYVMTFADFFCMYGIFSSIQGFSASAYGSETLGLIFPLREIAKVIGYSIFLVKPVYSFKAVVLTFLLGSLAGFYCLAVAVMIPLPPFHGLLVGKIMIVCAWVCEGLFLIYCRAAIAWIIRRGPNSRKHLIWSGLVSQVGSVTALVIMFPLINVARVFN